MLINLACLSVFLIVLPSAESLFGNVNVNANSKGGLLSGGLLSGGLLSGGLFSGANSGGKSVGGSVGVSAGLLGNGLLSGFLGGNGGSSSLQDAIDNLLGLTACKTFPCQHKCTSSGSSKYVCSCEPNYRVNPNDITRCIPNVVCTVNPDGTIKGVVPPVIAKPVTLPPITGVGNVKPCTSAGKVDLIVVIDSSGSITRPLYPNSFSFLLSLFAAFPIGVNDLQVAALLFSSTVSPLFDFSAHVTLNDIRRFFANPIYLNSQTYTWKAFDYIGDKEWYSARKGARPDANKVVIVITDGGSQNTAKTLASAKKLRDEEGALIIVVAVGNNVDLDEVKGIASSSADIFRCNDYNALASIVAKVTLRACNLKLGLGVSVNAKVTG